MTSYPFALYLETPLPASELEDRIKAWQPWGHRIEFSNGVTTADFERRTPFSDNPLQKFDIVMKAIGGQLAETTRTLDIGCNAGYNSIAASQRFGAEVVGIDTSHRHIEVSTALAEMGGVSDLCTFKVESAETLEVAGEFDLILHFGTLYHLPNPILSLQRCHELARPGAWLALETQIFRDESNEDLCAFMNMQNNDPTNFWALSPSVLERILGLVGFSDLEILVEARPAILEPGMSRIVAVARKADHR